MTQIRIWIEVPELDNTKSDDFARLLLIATSDMKGIIRSIEIQEGEGGD